jgi:hypothetical protein
MSHLQCTACYFYTIFPTTAKIYVNGKELKMLLYQKLSNCFDCVTLSYLITTLKKLI